MKRDVKPLGKQLLVHAIKKSTTDGGIVLPDSARQDEGLKLIAIGPESKKKGLKVGDFLAVDARGLSSVVYEGVPDDYFLCNEDAVLATINFK